MSDEGEGTKPRKGGKGKGKASSTETAETPAANDGGAGAPVPRDAGGERPAVDETAPAGTFARGDAGPEPLDLPLEDRPTTEMTIPSSEAPAEEIPTGDEPPATGQDCDEPLATSDAVAAPPTAARIDYDETTLAQFVEALLFVAQRPLSLAQLSRPLRTTFAAVRKALKTIGAAHENTGVRLVEVGGGWQLRTAPECADVVRRFLDAKPLRLSKAAMETLAVISYRQPVTKPDVDEIRGVDSGSAVKLLLDRNLVRVLGRKEEPGRPLLYGTTQTFLEFFGLGNLNDLPSLREYAELSEEGRRQLERDLFARAPEAIGLGDEPHLPHGRHWQDLVEVLGDDIGGLPDGVSVEPESTGDPLQDYLLATGGVSKVGEAEPRSRTEASPPPTPEAAVDHGDEDPGDESGEEPADDIDDDSDRFPEDGADT
jgi:segregation and condensation protein B